MHESDVSWLWTQTLYSWLCWCKSLVSTFVEKTQKLSSSYIHEQTWLPGGTYFYGFVKSLSLKFHSHFMGRIFPGIFMINKMVIIVYWKLKYLQKATLTFDILLKSLFCRVLWSFDRFSAPRKVSLVLITHCNFNSIISPFFISTIIYGWGSSKLSHYCF